MILNEKLGSFPHIALPNAFSYSTYVKLFCCPRSSAALAKATTGGKTQFVTEFSLSEFGCFEWRFSTII